MVFLERLLGVSKPTFLATRVIPANPNDAYYDRHCTFCWEIYAEGHQGVRVLPCDHIFGADCLQNMISSTNGHLCPICRCTLFRPSGKIVNSELLWTLFDSVGLRLQALYGRAIALYQGSSPRTQRFMRLLKGIAEFKLYQRNPYYWATIIIKHTNLETHVPSLNLWHPHVALQFLQYDIFWPIRCYLRYGSEDRWVSTRITNKFEIGMSIGIILYSRCTGFDGVCPCKRESGIFGLIMSVSFVIAHMPNLWTLWDLYHQQDTVWLLRAAYDSSPALTSIMAPILGNSSIIVLVDQRSTEGGK